VQSGSAPALGVGSQWFKSISPDLYKRIKCSYLSIMSDVMQRVNVVLVVITVLTGIMYIMPIPIQSVLCLVCTFVIASAVIVIIGAEFIGLIFMVVYVGAIAVLFLFVVMMLHTSALDSPTKHIFISTTFLGRLRLGMGMFDIVYAELYTNKYVFEVITPVVSEITYTDIALLDSLSVSKDTVFNYVHELDDNTDLVSLGSIMYTYYGVYVIIAGFVLLVGMVGSIVLTRKVRTVAMSARQQAYQQTSRDTYNAIVLVPSVNKDVVK
jgi:NADH:ubiquinone oxidoreductase subunit 6 (subunit J)